jgi:hypothetical protein
LNPVSIQEAIKESGMLLGVNSIAAAGVGTDLNPALEFSLDEEEISFEHKFSEEPSFPNYEFLSLPVDI